MYSIILLISSSVKCICPNSLFQTLKRSNRSFFISKPDGVLFSLFLCALTISKYAVIGVAGYLIGFYEMKYKVIKAIANGAIEREMKEFEEEQEEES